jgi:hypothetical protein
MSDLICRRSMQRCQHPGMCSPHGGCQPDKSEWQSGYDEGRRMGGKTALDEREQLKVESEALRKDAERYRGVRRVANRQGFTDEQFDQQTDSRIANFDEAMAKERGQ